MTDRGNLKLADGKELVTVLETGDRFDELADDRAASTTTLLTP